MKNRCILSFFLMSCFGLSLISCNQNTTQQQELNKHEHDKKKVEVVLKDYGPEPTILNIEAYTKANTNFRTALWTGQNLQVILMSIPVGLEVGLEMHEGIDQFLRIEEGTARIEISNKEGDIEFVEIAEDDFAVFIPAGKWHNISNAGDKPLKLYSIYSPAEHPRGTIHETYEEAMLEDHHHQH